MPAFTEDRVRPLLTAEQIDCFGIIPIGACRITREYLLARAGIDPAAGGSVLMLALPYRTDDSELPNVSHYAVPTDYHAIAADLFDRLLPRLREIYPTAKFVGFADHSPIDERHAALTHGLGILGDNGLLITEDYGSYVFIGDVLTDIPAEHLGAEAPQPIRRCEGCGACRRACPTGILRGEGDGCLSAITQQKGALTEEEIAMMRRYHTVWGCDECQRHCPHNRSPRLSPLPFFHEARIEELTLDILDRMDEATFHERAFAWRGRKTVRRNLLLFEKDIKGTE